MEDGDQAIIEELREINLGITNDAKPIFNMSNSFKNTKMYLLGDVKTCRVLIQILLFISSLFLKM